MNASFTVSFCPSGYKTLQYIQKCNFELLALFHSFDHTLLQPLEYEKRILRVHCPGNCHHPWTDQQSFWRINPVLRINTTDHLLFLYTALKIRCMAEIFIYKYGEVSFDVGWAESSRYLTHIIPDPKHDYNKP